MTAQYLLTRLVYKQLGALTRRQVRGFNRNLLSSATHSVLNISPSSLYRCE